MSRCSIKGTIFSIKTDDIDKEQTSTEVTVTKAYGGMTDAVLEKNLLQFNEEVKRYKEKNNVFKVKTKMSIKTNRMCSMHQVHRFSRFVLPILKLVYLSFRKLSILLLANMALHFPEGNDILCIETSQRNLTCGLFRMSRICPL